MQQLPKIILKSGKDQAIRRFHPWIFSGAIKHLPQLTEGDVVEVYDNKNNYLATGHFQIGSIAVRLFSYQPTTAGSDFWHHKVAEAVAYRRNLGFFNQPGTTVFRLIHAEADGFPGLIVDFYNGVAVLQCHTVGMYRLRHTLAEALQSVLGKRLTAIYDKSKASLPFKARIDPQDGWLLGTSPLTEVQEHNNRFLIDIEHGQKTGFFIDQRENRHLLSRFAHQKKVLNLFCYTGGFSVAAMQSGAAAVDSVDSSKPAIELTQRNIALNYPDATHHRALSTDAFRFLQQQSAGTYDIMVLDPPAFAKHQKVLDKALRGYRKLNQAAFEQIKAGGMLFTFSCSQVVSRHDFRMAVMSAGAAARRRVRILYQLSQPPDHPVNIYHPESEYLKGLVLYVE